MGPLLVLLLHVDFDEVAGFSERVQDATEQKFFFYAKHSGGASIAFHKQEELEEVMVCVRRAYQLARH
jgi:hypothetical protein